MKVALIISGLVSVVVLVITYILETIATAPFEGVVMEMGRGSPMAWVAPVVFAILSFGGVFALFAKIYGNFN